MASGQKSRQPAGQEARPTAHRARGGQSDLICSGVRELRRLGKSSLLALLDEPDFTRLATGVPKSGSAPQPESGGNRGNPGSHPFPSL